MRPDVPGWPLPSLLPRPIRAARGSGRARELAFCVVLSGPLAIFARLCSSGISFAFSIGFGGGLCAALGLVRYRDLTVCG